MRPRKRLVKWVLAHVEAPGSSWRPANSKAILQACGGQVYKALEQLGAGRGEQGKDDPTLSQTVWPSGLRRWLQAPVRKGVGSNPTAVTLFMLVCFFFACTEGGCCQLGVQRVCVVRRGACGELVVPGQEVRGRRRQVPRNSLCSLVAERQSCKLKVLGSIPSGGFFRQIAPCALMSLLSLRDFQFFFSST